MRINMFTCLIPLLVLALLGAPASEVSSTEATEAPTGPNDAAVGSLAGFDLGSISKKDAGDWVVLRLTENEGSGSPVLGDRNEKGFATVGKWERIASLISSRGAERDGKYFWATNEVAKFQHYNPLNEGGFVLAQHYPKKTGKEQFGTVVLLSEDTAKWVAAAYQFRTKNADLFGKQFDEKRLLKLLGDENPMIAIMAAQRLAKAHSDRLAGKALGPRSMVRPTCAWRLPCTSGSPHAMRMPTSITRQITRATPASPRSSRRPSRMRMRRGYGYTPWESARGLPRGF